MATALSEYELQRLENIRRNQKVLESLGLVSRDAELHQDMRKCDPRAKKQKAAPATEGGAEDARAAVRRSHRLAGRPAEATDVDGGAGDTLTGEHGRARDDYEAAWARRWSGQQASTTPAGTCADMCRGVRAVPEAQGSLPQGATQGTYTYRPQACLAGFVCRWGTRASSFPNPNPKPEPNPNLTPRWVLRAMSTP